MPYKLFIKQVEGKKKWCTRNLRTGQIVCYSSPEKRATGIRMREMFAHIKTHKRRTKRGRIIVNEHYRKIPVTIKKEQRIMFDNLSKKDREIGGMLDFGKKGKLENITFNNGNNSEVYMDNGSKDKELAWHTHPPNDWTAFSSDDMQEILKDKSQQGEILFHDGQALSLIKPKALNRQKFLREYNSTLKHALREGVSERQAADKLTAVLKKHKFIVKKHNKGQPIKLNIYEVH